MEEEELDEILGITRCARCGQRLDGEVECPFCSSFPLSGERKELLPAWVFLTACFATSPLSLYAIIRTRRLGLLGKLFAASGAFVWLALFLGGA